MHPLVQAATLLCTSNTLQHADLSKQTTSDQQADGRLLHLAAEH